MGYNCENRNKGGICIPNSTTGDLTVNDVDYFNIVMLQLDQHVSSNDTLHQDCENCENSTLTFMREPPYTL